MTQSNSSMNFLPEDYVEKRQAARTAVICIGLLVIVVTGIVGAWLFVQWQARPTFEQAAKVDAEFDDMSKKISEAQEMNAEKAKMLAKAELTTTLMERVRRSALLEELTRLQPKGVNMVSLEMKSRELPQPQLSDVDKAKRQQDGLPPEPEKPPEFEFTLDLIGTAPQRRAGGGVYLGAGQEQAARRCESAIFRGVQTRRRGCQGNCPQVSCGDANQSGGGFAARG